MKHPPYQLRQNKSVDRMLLFDVLETLRKEIDFTRYTYYGLGGPFLDDFRLFSSRFEFIKAVCIEKDSDTYKRQQFHKNSRFLKLFNESVNDFLTNHFPDDCECIFWLDYTDLTVNGIEGFKRLLALAGNGSIIKITVNISQDRQKREVASEFFEKSEVRKIKQDWADKFSLQFDRYLPNALSFDEMSHQNAPLSVQGMLRVAAGQALPSVTGTTFQLLHSCTYYDGVHQMLSLTVMKLEVSKVEAIQNIVTGWKFSNVDWNTPDKINVPILSLKERLALERHLPAKTDSVKAMKNCLGYKIGRTDRETDEMLKQYKNFHRFFPIYAKIGV